MVDQLEHRLKLRVTRFIVVSTRTGMRRQMSLPIKIEDIYFGDRDGLHEYMKSDRLQSSSLDNAFVNPPRVKMRELQTGARYIIVGPKGTGKTTLLWHLKRNDSAEHSKVVLFKSEIRKEDRDKLDRMTDMIVVEDQNKYRQDADYKTVWEWYILKNIIRLMSPDDILLGKDIYQDIALILEADRSKFSTLYDKMYVERVKGNIKLNFDVGLLKTELKTEIEARRVEGNKISLLDLVRLVQAALPSIRLKTGTSIRLYFDELEFFMSSDGDGERDRRMVRDILFATYSVNTLCSNSQLNIVVYASVRTEVLSSIGTTTQEINKIVSAFGVTLQWFSDSTNDNPILQIFENKIKFSEVDMVGGFTEDVWSTYFPAFVEGKEIKKYLLDAGLHRPRGVLLLLTAAAGRAGTRLSFQAEDFTETEEIYGSSILEEFTEELAASLSEAEIKVILALFRGSSFAFTIEDIETRLRKIGEKDKVARSISSKIGVENLLRFLFRIGMIGNQFDLMENNVKLSRNMWAVRGYEMDPAKRFVLHQSVRKILVTI